MVVNKESLQKIFRFAYEEVARRGLKPDAEPLNKS